MKTYLIKVGKFSGILSLWFVLMLGANLLILRYHPAKIEKGQMLIMGDSHPQRALNPKLFESATNVSQVAEPLYITYWKLKDIVQHAKVDTLVLGLSPHNLSTFNDHKLEHKKWASEMFKRVYAIEAAATLDSVEVDWEKLYGTKFRKMCLYPIPTHKAYLGGYSNSNKSKVTDANQAANRHFCWDGEEAEISETVVAHLDSIVFLCREQSIELVVVTAPQHATYLRWVPQEFDTQFAQLKRQLSNDGATILDYSTAKYADELFLNADHLNQKGAKRFSKEVRNELYVLSEEGR